MAKKKDEAKIEATKKYVGIEGTEVLTEDPAVGASAFGVAAEPTDAVLSPAVVEEDTK